MKTFEKWIIVHRVTRKAVLLIFVLLVLQQTSYFQDREFTSASQLLNEMRRSYGLNARDIKRLTPLVDNERLNVLRIYTWFSGDEPEYSHRVWQRMIAQRQDFEASIATDLTRAQSTALRGARSRVESQMLKLLVQDYVLYLSQSLELDIGQLDNVAFVFETENRQLYASFTRHLSDPSLLSDEMEKIEAKTQEQLRGILNTYQWRDYRSLFESDELVAFTLTSSHSKVI